MLTVDEGWDRDPPTRQQLRNDVVLALALGVLAVLGTELYRSIRDDVAMGWWGIGGYLLPLAMALVLAVRRRFPDTALVVCAVGFYVLGELSPVLGAAIAPQVSLFIAFYTTWAWSRQRVRTAVVSLVVVVAMFVWVGALLITNQDAPDLPPAGPGIFSPGFAIVLITLIINVGYFLGAIAWGMVAWRSARQRHALREQAEELRREQELSARRAVADERLRIARDLHDVVAHHVSGIGVQAAGARRLLERDPDASRQALATIEGSSRTAVREMHQLVSILRTDDDEAREPQPGLADLPALVARVREEGLDVDHREVGEPFEVPSTVGLSLFRTVQEAVANVRRHSMAQHAEVVLRWLDGCVEVEVLDDGRPRPVADGETRGGFGLRGIRERAAMLDGEHEIGPRPNGGFRVRVRVPVDGAGEGER